MIYLSAKTVGSNPEEGKEMETIKENILKAISEEHTNVYRFIQTILSDFELDESMESNMVITLTNSMDRWADTRDSMHKALTKLISTATEHQSKIQLGFDVHSGWVQSNRYEEKLAEAKMWENEISTLTRLIGLGNTDRINLFKKLNSLIKF
jgi:hypothetical protein